MNIKTNNYLNQSLYTMTADERTSKSHVGGKINGKAKLGSDSDTVSISIAGQQFLAEQMESDSEMGLMRITSDLDSFRSAVNSMKGSLPVNWTASVDPYGTFRSFAKFESRIKQLTDPNVSHNDADMNKVAEAYANEKINALIEKKKTMIANETAKTSAEEYEEYKTAYDAYHSENGNSLIAMMTGDTKKAYNIYKDIIDGTKISIDAEEFLMLHNSTMYRAAKGEYIQKTDKIMAKR